MANELLGVIDDAWKLAHDVDDALLLRLDRIWTPWRVEESLPDVPPEGTMVFTHSRADARGHLVGKHSFAVVAGSEASLIARENLYTETRQTRDRLIETGVLIRTERCFRFRKTTVFTSPSQAAGAVHSSRQNGRKHWEHGSETLGAHLKRSKRR